MRIFRSIHVTERGLAVFSTLTPFVVKLLGELHVRQV